MSYSYSRSLTADGTLVPTTQSDFRALFSLSDPDLKAAAFGGLIENLDSGLPADFAIFSDAGLTTQLAHKIISYNASTGEILGWVKLPTLNAGSDTTLYVAYGDAAITTYQGNDTGIYDANIIAHYELGDGSSLSVADSSGNGFDGTAVNSPTAAAGKIHGAGDFESTSDQYIGIPNNLITNSFTWSAWVNAESFPAAYNSIIVRNNGTFFTALYVRSDGKLTALARTQFFGPPGYDGTGIHTLSTSTWYRLTISGDDVNFPTRCRGHVNGVLDGSGTEIYDYDTSAITTRIASDPNNSGSFEWDGLIDDVVLESTERSDDWLLTEYRNQNDPAAFWTLGGEPFSEGSAAVRERTGFRDRLTYVLLDGASESPHERVGITDRLTYQLLDTVAATIRERIGVSDRISGEPLDAVAGTIRERIGVRDRVTAESQQPYGPAMVALTHLYLDEGTENYSGHRVIAPSHTHAAKVISFGSFERECQVPSGPPRLSDMVIELDDSPDKVTRVQYFRSTFGAKTPRMRKADVRIGPVGGKEHLFAKPAHVTVRRVTFPPLRCRIEGSDLRSKFLEKPLPMLINSANFPNLPPGVTEAFFPFAFGIIEAELGALKAIHIDTVLHRYTAAFHPVDSVDVFTKTPDQADPIATPYSYTLVEDPLILDGRENRPTYIQFGSALPEGTEVFYNIHGVNFRGGWGTLAPITTVSRNVVDHLINILFYIKRLDEPSPDFSHYDIQSFAEVRDKIDALGILSDYAITEPLTGWEIVTQLTGPPIVHMITDNHDRIKLVKITDADLENAPTINDRTGTVLKSELITLASPTYNQYRYRTAFNHVTRQYGAEATYDNAPDQEALGEIEALQVDMPSIRDADVAADLIAERSLWEDQEAHRIRLQLDYKTHQDTIDLMKPFKLTHYGGLATGGWVDELFIPYRVKLVVDKPLIWDIDAIRRPVIANPKNQVGTIGQWSWNSRVGPEYVTSARAAFAWFTDDRAANKKLVVLATNTAGNLVPIDDGVYPTLGNVVGSHDGIVAGSKLIVAGSKLHLVAQEKVTGRVSYTRVNIAKRQYEILNQTVIASNSHGDYGVTIDVQEPSGKVTIMFQGDREFSSGFAAFPFSGPAGYYQRAYVTTRNANGTWSTPQMMGSPAAASAQIWFPIWGDPNYNGAVHIQTGRAKAGLHNRVHFVFSRVEPGDVAVTPDFMVQTLRTDGTLSDAYEWELTGGGGGGANSAAFLGGDPAHIEDENGDMLIVFPVGKLAEPKLAIFKDIDNPTVPYRIILLSMAQVPPDTFGARWAPMGVRDLDGTLRVVHATRVTSTEEWGALKTIDAPVSSAEAVPGYASNARDVQVGARFPVSNYARSGFDLKRLRDGRPYLFKLTSGNFGIAGTNDGKWIFEKIALNDLPTDYTLADFIAANT